VSRLPFLLAWVKVNLLIRPITSQVWDERTWPIAKAHPGRMLEVRRDSMASVILLGITACASGTAAPMTTVTQLSAIEGRWYCTGTNSDHPDAVIGMRIQVANDQAATMRLVWRSQPTGHWDITMQQGVAVIGYPSGGQARLPLQWGMEGGREFLAAVQKHGRTWLECNRSPEDRRWPGSRTTIQDASFSR